MEMKNLSAAYVGGPYDILENDHEYTKLNKWCLQRNLATTPLEEILKETNFKLKDLSSFADHQNQEIGEMKKEILALYEKMEKLKDECDAKDATIDSLTEENRSSYRLKDDLDARIMQLQPCIQQTHKQEEVIENLRNDKASYFLYHAKMKDQLKECIEDNKILADRSKSLVELTNFYVQHQLDECTDDSPNYRDLENSEAAFFDAHFEKEEGRNKKPDPSKSHAAR